MYFKLYSHLLADALLIYNALTDFLFYALRTFLGPEVLRLLQGNGSRVSSGIL